MCDRSCALSEAPSHHVIEPSGVSPPARRLGDPATLLVIAVWLLTTFLWLTPGLTRPDGVGYFAYLPSTWLDRDLLFFDEWAQMGLIRDGQILFKVVTPTGHLSNHWTAGASLAWYPAFVAGDALARAIGEKRNGFSLPYVTAIVFTSALAGLFVLLGGRAVARSLYGTGAATAAAIAMWLGSPLAFYSLRHASMSHAISAAACASVVLLSLQLRERVDARRLIACGLAVGFACAVRPQNVVMALVPFLIVDSAARLLTLRNAGTLFLSALFAALPQLIVSQTLWGSPLAFVNIGGQAHPWQMFRTFRPFETMFSWYHGLATWTPLLLIAVAGFALLWRDDRGLARAAFVTFGAQWLLLSTLERWFWGGASFGQRRFDSCAIFFILGVAAVLRRLPVWLGALLMTVTSGWTMILFIASTKLNLNRFQTPDELLEAFRNASPAWRTWLGFVPERMQAEVLLTIGIVAIGWTILLLAARRHGLVMATGYLLLMTAFFAWCGAHPKENAFSRELVARRMPSGSARDTATLLRYEADYMMRTGRPAEAEAALRESLAIAP